MQKPLSRLEKFIYALCSLDSSELPNPLSRLEVLLNCLVTGETPPAFEPLSRNEKYLMAISGSYHDELPNPISRGEKLLYKLATGDDSIDDIGEALSRYEELLAYIVENGCLDGPIDVGYVTYILMSGQNTLYNTKELPVKSAFLTGQTLVNHLNLSGWGEEERKTLVADGTSKTIYLDNPSTIKVNTKYLTIIPIYENTINSIFSVGGWGYYDSQPIITNADGTGIIKKIETTRSSDDRFHQGMYVELWGENTSGQITFGKPMIIEYQDGMENWDIPYFECMQSVKMPVLKTVTEYEPHKSTTVTCNEEVELRGIGDVKDELDLMTGELTQRIGEVVFDGSEDWVLSADVNSTMFYTSFNNLVHKKDDYRNSISCDKCIVHANESYLLNSTSPNGISAYADWKGAYPNENWIYIKYADSEGYVEKLKQWLSQNPITVQYELATESVKTVDLSVVNQDGNDTKLSTFNDITYVTLSSEGLIPEAELEVATKNEEVLNTMSLRMGDISTTQANLNETVNTQSENVDATMIATTEIYEGLL